MTRGRQACDVAIWRAIVKNNAAISHVHLQFDTDCTWLPHALVEAGFFPSTSEIKRNRPDLWRDIPEGGAWLEFPWAEVEIFPGLVVESEPS